MFCLFFISPDASFAQDPSTILPAYSFTNKIPWGSVSQEENSDLTIAIDTDSKGNLYRLTFGKGVLKYDAGGNNEQQFISPNKLDAPMDFAIDSEDNFYILDFEDQDPFTDNGKIRIFDSGGQELPNKTIYTSYFRPLGIAIDKNDNIYVGIYNDGTGAESDISSEIRVYNTGGTQIKPAFTGTVQHPLNIPYRVAVDSQNNLYVSHAGISDGDPNTIDAEVLVFDPNYNYIETLNDRQLDGKGLGIPGSIVIDSFGYIHVIDYVNYVDFEKILNYQTISTFELINLALKINSGVTAHAFNIKIYDPNRKLVKSFYDYDKDQIKLPVDLAFGYCSSKMYVDNANPNLDNLTLDFNLLMYNRTPSFDNEPPVIQCPDDIQVQTDPGKDYVIVDFDDATAIDNCSTVLVAQTGGASSGSQFNIGTHPIKFTATDAAGNSSSCSFNIIVSASDEAPKFQNCSSDLNFNNDPGKCGAIVTFPMPTASDENGSVQVVRTDNGPASGELFPVGSTNVKFSATDDQGNTSYCEFSITVTDNETPAISVCPNDKSESFDPNTGFTIPNYTDLLQVSDNCTPSSDIIIEQNPLPGTVIYQSVDVTFKVKDQHNNINNACSFHLELTEESSLEITCPGDQQEELQENCSFKLPDYSGMAQVNKPGASVSQDPAEGTEITGGILVTLTATLNGETDSCTFKVTPSDTTAPVLVCPANQTQTSTNGEAQLDDYKALVQVSDNCSVNLSQSPTPGTTISSDTTVKITATDASGNSTSCSFQVVLTEGEVPLKIDCPGEQQLGLGEDCQVSLPDYRSLAGVTNSAAEVSQSPPPNTLISQDTTVILEASLNGETDACAFDVIVSDKTPPEVSCVESLDITLDAAAKAEITPEMLVSSSSDNCGITGMSLDRSVFGTPDIGENNVVLSVSDAAGNITTCTTKVNVHAYNPNPNFTCLETYNLELDENGEASLAPSVLYEGNTSSVEFSLDRTSFTCADIGEVMVTLSYSGNGLEGSCEIRVEVSDKRPPELQLQDIEVFLDETGNATILPQDLDAGTTDNCSGVLIWSANKTKFDCETEGPNNIEVSVSDASGNTTTGSATVYVNPNPEACDTTQLEDTFDYLFIYPNPNAGDFSIYAPEGVSISRVNAFDVRGRLIKEKVFEAGTEDYQVDLGSVRQAVYILQIITNDGEVIRRVIIEN